MPGQSTFLPKVAAVVAVYNRKAQTREFIRRFKEITYPNAELIIIDDGSPDGTAEMIRNEFPHVVLLAHAGNLWWSKATNLGVKEAIARGAEYILTINDDVEFNPDFLEQLIAYVREHPRTLVGSIIYELDRPFKIWYAGGKRSLLFGEMNHRGALDDGVLEWLTGMGTLIPSDVFRAIGYYDDEHFPQYSGDADLSMRAHSAGFDLSIQPASVLRNRTGESGDVALQSTLSFNNFFQPLISRKSTSHIGVKFHILMRHWPLWLAPIAFVLFYAKLFAQQIYRILIRRRGSRGA